MSHIAKKNNATDCTKQKYSTIFTMDNIWKI